VILGRTTESESELEMPEPGPGSAAVGRVVNKVGLGLETIMEQSIEVRLVETGSVAAVDQSVVL
jgi:hypothetical protein